MNIEIIYSLSNRDLGGGLLHDLLDRRAALADDPTDEVVVRQDLGNGIIIHEVAERSKQCF